MTECQRLITTLAIISATVGCAKKADQAEHAKQVGWANTHWGMSEQQIRDLYPQAQVVQQNPNIKGEQARLRVDKFQLDGEPFSVQFLFDSAGGLHEVILLQRIDDWVKCIPMSVTFGRFEELLNQKYGKPSIRTEKRDEWEAVWNTRDMIVSLAYFPFGVSRDCSLFITYKQPKAEALDHL